MIHTVIHNGSTHAIKIHANHTCMCAVVEDLCELAIIILLTYISVSKQL